MSNRTLYVKPEDEAIWEQAKKLIPRHEGVSLSQHLSDHLRQVVERYKDLSPEEEKSRKALLDALKAVERWSFDTATEISPDVYAKMRTAMENAEVSA